MTLHLNSYKVSSLAIINEKTPDENQELKMSYQYGIHVSNEKHCAIKCIGILHIPEEDDKDDKTFFVKLTIEGFFSYTDADKDTLRKQGSYELLPLMRSHIATAMASAGMNPILIPLESMKQFSDIAE